MLIHVVYPGMQHDFVKDFMLHTLIENNKIIRFRRSSGWVTLGVDPVRAMTNRSGYKGVERRVRHHDDFNVTHS
jgi:hypothetical protein